MSHTPRILLVEDEAIITTLINDLLAKQGYQVIVCRDGGSAWQRLQTDGPVYDVVILDRGLPDMDGMELLRRIKQHADFARTPVIIETARDDSQSIREGLDNGAYYYLVKPFEPEVMLAVVDAAQQQGRELRDLIDNERRAERPLALIQNAIFQFRTLEEARSLAHCLARTCPQSERVIQGLLELLVNAVEHGNLAISYAEKSHLLLSGHWQQEVDRRLQLPEYRDRYVSIQLQRQPQAVVFTIQDQGAGFDWPDYLEFSPQRAFDLHGRGIAMAAKLSFDRLEYQGNGNRVVATCNNLVTPQHVSQQ